jgi:alpha-tubulin suppressor-like RCC1 family protein
LNYYGQLGDGTNTNRNTPVQIGSGYSAIAAGGSHTLALKGDGSLWSWGINTWGQLGDGDTTQLNAPVQVGTGYSAIAAGAYHTLALKIDGSLWAWGANGNGQLGDGTTTQRNTPTQIGGDYSVITAGRGHSSALKIDGSLWTWGSNVNGELGDGTAIMQRNTPALIGSGYSTVNAGDEFTVALKVDGSVWAWASNYAGQLGDGTTTYRNTPGQIVGLNLTAPMDTVPDVFSFAAQSGVSPNAVALSDAITVSGLDFGATPGISVTGGEYSINGSAFTNVAGTVIRGQSVVVRLTASSATITTTSAVLTIGGVSASFSVTTKPPGPAVSLSPTGLAFDQTQGTTSSNHNVALTNSGVATLNINSISVSGDFASSTTCSATLAVNATCTISVTFTPTASGVRSGTLSIASDAPGSPHTASLAGIGTLLGAVAATGWDHTLTLKSDGTLWAWGDNSYGQLGDGTTTNRAIPVLVGNGYSAVAAGDGHTVALKSDGSLWAWGWNLYGQLGDGTSTQRIAPVQIGSGYGAVAAGGYHTLALKADGSLWSWGDNSYGQLGNGSTTNRNSPVQIGASYSAISAGYNHTLALKADGSLWVWGDNSYGQLGNGTTTQLNTPVQTGTSYSVIAAGYNHSLAVRTDGSLWGWGGNIYGQLGDGSTTQRKTAVLIGSGYSAVTVGAQHTVALMTDGSLWAWGANGSGQLGDGTAMQRNNPVLIGRGYNSMAAGSAYTLAMKTEGSLWAWGDNSFGQLGDGTFAQHTAPILVVNETTNGYFKFTPGADFQVPPSVGVPFFVAASGGITATSATVSTITKFNASDIGNLGAVFVTAAVPPGSLVPVQSSMDVFGASGVSANSNAETAATSFVLIQLTSSGWQVVVNGQLLPYAIGVLSDQLSAQTILENIDTTNLKSAQFCLGYGASAEEMIAAGTMRVIASIPDPSATGRAAPSCVVAGPSVSYSLALLPGWNLLGNSLNQALSVASLYGDPNTVTTVWKWDTSTLRWQFYTPTMDAATLQPYATGKGYGVLTTLNPGDGYWVNTKAQPPIGTQSGTSFILTSLYLANGWNLVATGNDITPKAFNTNLKSSLPGTGVTTLWAWDNPTSSWYFYAPLLEAQGGTALSDYINNKGYLDFTKANKTLGNGTGFWVNR